MVKCAHCGRNIRELPFRCHFCGKYSCSKHRLPEDHNCFGLEKYKKRRQKRWLSAFKKQRSKRYSEPYKPKSPVKLKLRKFWWKIKRPIRNLLIAALIIFLIFQGIQYIRKNNIDIEGFFNKTGEKINDLSSLFKTDPEKYRTAPKKILLNSIDFIVYGGVNDYLSELDRSISYYYSPPTTKDFILRNLDNEVQDYYLSPLVNKIKNKTDNKNEQVRIAISLVQSIPYDWGAFRTNNIEGRYPYEVIYDMTGVCMEKSDLLAYLLRELDFGVVIFEFEIESHRAVGILCNNGNYNTDYCFIESTDYYPVGSIPANYVGGVNIRNAVPEIIFISEGYKYTR